MFVLSRKVVMEETGNNSFKVHDGAALPDAVITGPAAGLSLRVRLFRRLKRGEHHFSKWLNQTSIHGIVHVFKGKSRLRRLIWLVIFIVAVIGCAVVLGFDIEKWASDPTTTTVSTEDHSRDGVSFPAVTVCNLNAVRKSYKNSSEAVELLNGLARSTSHFLIHNPYSAFNKSCNQTLEGCDNHTVSTSIHEAYEEGGHLKDDFIKYCGFSNDGTKVTSCEAELIPYLTSLGICYTFNSAYSESTDKLIRRAGPVNGLHLIFNINRLEYSKVTYGNVGIKVLVHPRDAFPIPDVQGITVSPGVNAFIAVEAIKNIDDTTESNCLKKNRMRSMPFFPNHSYTVSTCTVNDLYKGYADSCGCTVDSHPAKGKYANIRNCTIADTCCILKRSRNNSFSDCPPLCEHTSYNIESSYSQFPSLQLAEDLEDEFNTSAVELQNNLVSINVYYHSLKITRLTTEYTYVFSNLMADMGGLLGLFIGASMISLLEVVVLVIDFVKSFIINKKIKEKVTEIEKKIQLVEIAEENIPDELLD